MSDYLWDKSGEPDPDVERLELGLAPLAYRGQAPRLPHRRAPVAAFVMAGLAAAALLSLIIWPPWHRPTSFVLDGHRLAPGSWIESGEQKRLLRVGTLGTVELAPQTRARVVGEAALELDHGSLTAVIHAAPRVFTIQTRWARVIDLGCAFELTLKVEGKLHVTEGSVALERDGRETVVSAGLECEFMEAGVGGVRAPLPPMMRMPPAPPPPLVPPAPPAPKNEPVTPKKPKLHVGSPSPAQPTAPKTNAKTNAKPDAAPTKPPKKDDSLKLHHDSLKDMERSL